MINVFYLFIYFITLLRENLSFNFFKDESNKQFRVENSKKKRKKVLQSRFYILMIWYKTRNRGIKYSHNIRNLQYRFQRFKEQSDMVYFCKAENKSCEQVFLYSPPHVLFLFCAIHKNLLDVIMIWYQYFQCYEPFPKLGQKGHCRLIHWTENQAPKHNHVREHNFVITDCVIFFKTFSSFFIMYSGLRV